MCIFGCLCVFMFLFLTCLLYDSEGISVSEHSGYLPVLVCFYLWVSLLSSQIPRPRKDILLFLKKTLCLQGRALFQADSVMYKVFSYIWGIFLRPGKIERNGKVVHLKAGVLFFFPKSLSLACLRLFPTCRYVEPPLANRGYICRGGRPTWPLCSHCSQGSGRKGADFQPARVC